jgi:prepilin-type N-terminal cleavage/methylation domain-containing protein
MTIKRIFVRTGMTLVEVLVVIAIIGVLLGLMLPAAMLVRESANQSTCRNHLRQIGLALHTRNSDVGCLPPAYTFDPRQGERLVVGEMEEYDYSIANDWEPMLTNPGWGWATYLLPYLEQGAVFQEINWNKSIEHFTNREVRKRIIKSYVCPSDVNTGVFTVYNQLHERLGECATNSYAACYGTGGSIGELPDKGDGLFFRNSRFRLEEIPDGASFTLAIGERGAKLCKASWIGSYSQGTVRTDPNAPIFIQAIEEPSTAVMARTGWYPLNSHYTEVYDFFTPHPGPGLFLFADGAVVGIRRDMKLEVWKAIATRAGSEAIGGAEF